MSWIRAREFGSLSSSWTPEIYPFEVAETSSATNTAVNIADAKNFLRIYDNVDDLVINTLIQAVTIQIEKYINKAIMLKTYRASWRRVGSYVRLPNVPFVDIVSAVSTDYEGNSQTLTDGVQYFVVGDKNVEIRLNGLNYELLTVTFRAGYNLPEQVPAHIKMAILQELSLQYKNRQDPRSPKIVINGLTLEARNLLQSEIDYVL